MPFFFNPNRLTDVQRKHWDAAIVEYARVQAANRGTQPSHMSVEPVEPNDPEQPDGPAIPGGDIMRAAKSALFARLLQGQPALPHPPPTSYAYPWYAVIEEPGPHQVRVDGGMDGQTVGLNRCSWTIRHMNDAASALLTLERDRRSDRWSRDLLSKVKAAYARGPELVVQFEPWPSYRLSVRACQQGEAHVQAARKYAQSVVRDGVHPGDLTGSVFDADALKLNARMGADIAHRQLDGTSADWTELLFDRWHLEKEG